MNLHPDALHWLLTIHAASTWAMAGLLWFVQLVHYPLFHLASRERFLEFSERHQRRTTWVVAPLMLVELAAASLLLVAPIDTPLAARVGWVLLIAIWASTALVQVPLHGRLSSGYSEEIVDRLVRTNWFRTLGWTVRGGLALLLLSA